MKNTVIIYNITRAEALELMERELPGFSDPDPARIRNYEIEQDGFVHARKLINITDRCPINDFDPNEHKLPEFKQMMVEYLSCNDGPDWLATVEVADHVNSLAEADAIEARA